MRCGGGGCCCRGGRGGRSNPLVLSLSPPLLLLAELAALAALAPLSGMTTNGAMLAVKEEFVLWNHTAADNKRH